MFFKKKILILSNQYYIDNNINNLTYDLAKLYITEISSLSSRILVKGQKVFLQDFKIQEKIRCLLFSGIRSIVLWKQFGGNQLKLIYFRHHVIQQAKKILFYLQKKT